MRKITPFLWFNDKAEEVVDFYLSIFKNSKRMSPVSSSGGPVMSVTFELEGQELIAFNGGPHFKFTPAISLFVNCYSQEEVDELWSKLVEGGAESRCGWLTDKYGMSWQIIPVVLSELLHHKDPVIAKKVLDAMLKMTKIEIEVLREAAGV